MQHIAHILQNQKKYFQSQKTRSVDTKLQALHNLAQCIKKYENKILEALFLDLGKAYEEGYMTEIAQVYEEINAAKKWVKRYSEVRRVANPMSHIGGASKLYHDPYGVVLVIAPWNYPISLSLSPLVGAIAAGNCVVLKPSEYANACADILEQIITEVFQKEQVSVVQGDYKVGQALLEQRFDYIFFTGSVNVGRIVMQQAAKNLTPVTLELGGKSPCIIQDYENVSLIAKRIVWGKFLNAGQTCIAPDLLCVQEGLKDEVIKNLKKYIIEFYAPHCTLDSTNKNIAEQIMQSQQYGKIISQPHFHRITDLLKDTEEKIGKNSIIFGGDFNEERLKISPTLIDVGSIEQVLEELNAFGADCAMYDERVRELCGDKAQNLVALKILQEELFAPIFPILTYKNFESCLDFIQRYQKPLALYLFSNDKEKQDYVMNNIAFGGGCINDCITHIANNNLPFGGVGDSGLGMYHGIYSAETFCRKKGIYHASKSFDAPFRYPPFNKKIFGLERLKILRWLFKYS